MIVAFTGESTALVWILKVPELSPAFIIILAGRVRIPLASDDNNTTWLPEGAALFNVTVPTKEVPLVTEADDMVNAETARTGIGLILISALRWKLSLVAVTLTVTAEVTALVPILKVPEIAPEGIVTSGGMVKKALGPDNRTARPPCGAGLFKVTVPTKDAPPTTEVCDTDTADKGDGIAI